MRSSALDELSRTHLLGNPLPFSRFGARLTTTWSACRRFRRCWTSPMCRRTSSTVRELCSLTRGRNPEQPRASPTLVSRASAAFSTISDSAPSAARYACMMRAKLDAAQQLNLQRYIVPMMIWPTLQKNSSGHDHPNLDTEPSSLCYVVTMVQQLEGIKRHGDLSFVVQPRTLLQGAAGNGAGASRLAARAYDSSETSSSTVQKKAVRSRRVSQLQSSSATFNRSSFQCAISQAEHDLNDQSTSEEGAAADVAGGHKTYEQAGSWNNGNVPMQPTSSHNQLLVDLSPRTPPRPSSTTSCSSLHSPKRRKGVPHRAPLGAWQCIANPGLQLHIQALIHPWISRCPSVSLETCTTSTITRALHEVCEDLHHELWSSLCIFNLL